MIEDGLIDTTDLDIISDCIEDDLIEMHQVTIDKTVLNECIRQYLSHHNIICNTLEERLLNKAW
jgi:Lhr-like helicase